MALVSSWTTGLKRVAKSLSWPHGPLWKEATTCSPHVSGQEPCSFSSRTDYLYKSFGIFLRERLCLTPFIYLCNLLHQPVLASTYTLGGNPTVLYLFGCPDPSGFGGRSSLMWLVFPFDVPPSWLFDCPESSRTFWLQRLLQTPLMYFSKEAWFSFFASVSRFVFREWNQKPKSDVAYV